MSITRAIELIKKPKNPTDFQELDSLISLENMSIEWKNRPADFWITDFLFDVSDLSGKGVAAPNEREIYYAILPLEVVQNMISTIEQKQYEVCEAAEDLDDDEHSYDVLDGVAKYLKKMLQNINPETEAFLYVDAGF